RGRYHSSGAVPGDRLYRHRVRRSEHDQRARDGRVQRVHGREVEVGNVLLPPRRRNGRYAVRQRYHVHRHGSRSEHELAWLVGHNRTSREGGLLAVLLTYEGP